MSNHAAIISKVEKIVPIEGADKVQVAVVLGEFCVVSKDVQVGDMGILFPADLQLSEEFCHHNNLFRDSSQNANKDAKGFFDANRKVRAQVFLKTRSTAFFTSLNSLAYTKKSVFELGERFNDIVVDGKVFPVCKRYISPQAAKKRDNEASNKAKKKKDVPLFLEHVDTQQLRHFIDQIPEGALLSFHAKAHGTSFRVANLPVKQNLPIWKQWVNRVIPVFPEEDYQLVVGSRRVILDNPDKVGFHGSEGYRFEVAKALEPFLSKGMMVYGEIVGFVNGSPVMPPHNIEALKDKKYTNKYGKSVTYSYGCSPHQYKWFIYRITVADADGNVHEFDQKKLEQWCKERAVEHTLEVHPQMIYDGNVENLKELVEQLTERPEVLTEDYRDPSHISEGIVLRVDYSGKTLFYKNKSVPFKICEGILTVDDVEDMS